MNFLAITTNNLGLIKPEINDISESTFFQMVNNFQVIDNVIPYQQNTEPISGYHQAGKKVEYQNPVANGYIGLVNLRSGVAAPKWSAVKQVNVGDAIVPTINNGHYYICTQSGYTAPVEPNWLVAAQTITEDTRNKSTWQPSKHYNVNDIVVPTIPNDRFYLCVTSGTSGTGEPNWATSNGISTVDNKAIWISYKIVKWKESGVSVNFRPYGKIE